jgi:hypothetical protein
MSGSPHATPLDHVSMALVMVPVTHVLPGQPW